MQPTMENPREHIGEWLQAYGVDEFNGACAFTWKESIEFGLELTADESHLVLQAVVGSAGEADDAGLFRKLLRLNYLGIQTDGATLSLDETESNVVLWVALPVDSLDPGEFDRCVGSFLDLSERISQSI